MTKKEWQSTEAEGLQKTIFVDIQYYFAMTLDTKTN